MSFLIFRQDPDAFADIEEPELPHQAASWGPMAVQPSQSGHVVGEAEMM